MEMEKPSIEHKGRVQGRPFQRSQGEGVPPRSSVSLNTFVTSHLGSAHVHSTEPIHKKAMRT